jgi:DNA-directed RNA polymerase specialized sigma24 family protein
MARPRSPHSVAIVLNEVFAAAWAACADEETAAEVTRRVLVADPTGRPEDLAARSACLAAGRGRLYARIPPEDRDALVLARVLGWKTDRIADQLQTTPAEIRARLGRGLRTLLPRPDCAAAASPGCAAHAS